MKATSDDIREYGLDSPICEVRYVVDGETYVLKVGNQVQEGYYAASFSGTQSIYRVAESSVSFAFTPADDYRSILLYVTNITDVAKLTVDAVNDSGNLISETFTLRHSTEETESGSTTTLVVNDSEGNAIVEDDFREFYQGIIGLTGGLLGG